VLGQAELVNFGQQLFFCDLSSSFDVCDLFAFQTPQPGLALEEYFKDGVSFGMSDG
jgi:hypothetical protein